MVERLLIRVLIGIALAIALIAFALTPVPVNAHGDPALPAPALEQVILYRLEVALLAFYGCLLLVTPALSGLLRGRLPIEISTRGAKFAADADETAAETEAAIRAAERSIRQLSQGLKDAQIEIESLQELSTVTAHNQG
ncbi:MAG: hypothetical protein ACTHNY_03030 [Solirubrobacterales bacterium]